MIVVDTSALMAIVLDEAEAERCRLVLAKAGRVLLSAATAVEALIVADRRGVASEMQEIFDDLDFEILAVTVQTVSRVLSAHRRWGKGVHPAKLNFGDCFAYALADERNCPLLFIGNDFSRTDIVPAMPEASGETVAP